MEVDEGLFSFFVDEFTKLRDTVQQMASGIPVIQRDQQAIRTDMTRMRLALEWGESQDMLTTAEVAEELGYTLYSVDRLIRTGHIGARRSGTSGNYMIPRSECERYKRRRNGKAA